MKLTLLSTTVSAFALLSASAFAEPVEKTQEELEAAAQEAADGVEKAAEKAEKTARAAADETGDAAEDAAKKGKQAAKETGDKVEDAARDVADAAANAADKVADAAGDAARATGARAEKVAEALSSGCDGLSDDDCAAIEEFARNTSFPVIRVGGKAFLGGAGLRASTLSSAEVVNGKDEKIGTIIEASMRSDGDLDRFILSTGGILNVGDRTTAHSFEALSMRRGKDGEWRFVADHARDELKKLAAVEPEEALADDAFLLGDMLNAEVSLEGAEETARIDDIVFDRNGDAAAVVMAKGDLLGVGGKRFLVDFNDIVVAEGDGGLSLSITPAQIERTETFYYTIKADAR